MKKTKNILASILLASVVLGAVIVALYENAILHAGLYEPHSGDEFVVLTVMELLTIIAIPTALRLFRFKKVREALKKEKEKALLRWGSIRIFIITVPMLVNTLLYYMFGFSTTFIYLAIALFISLVFIIPTKARCEAELNVE